MDKAYNSSLPLMSHCDCRQFVRSANPVLVPRRDTLRAHARRARRPRSGPEPRGRGRGADAGNLIQFRAANLR